MSDTEADLPTPELESRLTAELGEDVTDLEPLGGALNVMVAVTTENARYVLRRPTDLRESPLFNDLHTEYRVLERLQDTPVPAPEPVLYCADDSLLGEAFFLTTFLDGEDVPVGSPLPERFQNPDARRRFAENLVDALADIHSLDPGAFADVCERKTPREELEDAVGRLDHATSVTGRDVPDLWDAAEWLRENAPTDATTRLLHGDYKSGNVLFAETTDPEVVGVFDWETAFLGDPRHELGYFLFYWRDDGDPTPDLDPLRERYDAPDAIRDLEATNERGFYPYSNRPGSPTRRDLVARWEDQTGLSFDNPRFYRAHAAFGLATVWEDIHRQRVEAGDADPDSDPLLDYAASVTASIATGDFPL